MEKFLHEAAKKPFLQPRKLGPQRARTHDRIRLQKNTKDSKRFQRIRKDSKGFQRVQKIIGSYPEIIPKQLILKKLMTGNFLHL